MSMPVCVDGYEEWSIYVNDDPFMFIIRPLISS